MLDSVHARARQKRLLDTIKERKLDAIVVGDNPHVYYLSAFRPIWLHFAAFVLFADGRTWMTTGNKPADGAAVDEAVAYESNWLATLRPEQPSVVAGQVVDLLKSRQTKRIGIDASAVTSQVAIASDAQCESIDPILWQLRRRKDPDELALLRKAVACTDAMYGRAKEIIEPGLQEVDLFAELNAAAIREAGEPMAAILGNDYVSGSGGGPPRKDRAAKAGELYIIDVGPCYRGYFGDACRTYSVDKKPTGAQSKAADAILGALKIVEHMAKPGVRCREIYDAVFEHLKDRNGARFPHHLGHGIGLHPHEFPHLNPRWDDVLKEGEVFTAEPGLYSPALAGGIRIENDYLVTATGVENLNTSPLGLV